MLKALLLVAVVIAWTPEEPPPVSPPGKLVDLGGWRIHLNCTGKSKQGSPTVILEAGAGAFSVDWSLMQPQVSRFARVCSYDRAGLGWSEQGPHPRTLHQVVWELHTLLQKAQVPPPYIMVGHSAGGVLARLYTFSYPTDVRGVVLVDSGFEAGVYTMKNGQPVRLIDTATGAAIPPIKTGNPLRDDQIPARVRSLLEASAKQMASQALEPPYDKLPRDAQRMRQWAFGQIKHWATNDNPVEAEELATMAAKVRAPYALNDLPIVVISRGLDPDAEHDENQKALLGLSHRSRQIIAKRSVHEIMITEPAVVVEAIRDVVELSGK